MKCAAHPQVETNLRCNKCGKPICPKCMVETPVGAKCPDCARLSRLPTYQISTPYYLRATGAGLGTAIACGIIWTVIDWIVPFFYLNLLLAAAAGYAIGETISFSVNRKRGVWLAIIASIAVTISYLTSLWFAGLISGIPLFHNLIPHIFRIVFDLIAVALGIFIAVTRLR